MKKKIRITTVILLSLLLIACTANDDPNVGYEAFEDSNRVEFYEDDNDGEVERETPAPIVATAFYDYQEFEIALKTFTTDVVIARIVDHEYIGESIVFEFEVLERIFGDAGDRIYVIAERGMEVQFDQEELELDFRPGQVNFYEGVDYLLPLIRIDDAYADIQEDAFVLIRDIVIDLDNPMNSVMYSTPLYWHTEQLELHEDTPREDIIAHVYELVRDIVVIGRTIRSEAVEEIINGSPYVLVVEIGEPIRLAAEQAQVEWGPTDLYEVTVIESLKGEVNEGDEMVILFHADTVFQGERHIVATMPMSPGSNWHEFTSRYSLFQVGQIDEIMLILNGH